MFDLFCYFLIYIAEAITVYQYCSALFVPRHSKCFRIVLLILSFGVLSVFSWLDMKVLALVGFAIVNFLLLRLAYKTSWSTALFHTLISTAVMAICEIFVKIAAPYPAAYYYAYPWTFHLWLVPAIISRLVYSLIMHLLVRFSKWKKDREAPFDRMIIILIALPVVSLFIMCTFLLICDRITYTGANTFPDVSFPGFLWMMITACSILLLFLNIITWEFYLYNRQRNWELSQTQLSLQKESDLLVYYRMLIHQDEEQRRFIHDIKKHLQSIALLNEQGNSKKVASYIGTLTESSILKTSSRICSNDFLNALLCRYANLCMEQDISFRTDIRKDSVDFMSESDMTSLFCNLLDNSIAAAVSMSEPFVELSTSHQEHTPFTVVTIINSCKDDPFGTDKKELPQTHSRSDHGYGLKIINRMVLKYHGQMQSYYETDHHAFHIVLTLKNITDPVSG